MYSRSMKRWPALLAMILSAATGRGEQTVLNDACSWRLFHVLRPPVVDQDGERISRGRNVAWMDAETPEPPAGWQQPDFDDSSWQRTSFRGGVQTPLLARQCARGKFVLDDPAKAGQLTLTVKYHGGVVIHLNGVEVARRHMPAGSLDAKALAEAYSLEAHVSAAGHLLADAGTYIGQGRKAGAPDADSQRRMALRVRVLETALPAAALRRGLNVLTIEIVRAPYHPVLLETDAPGAIRHNRFDWSSCQALGINLQASGEGIVSGAQRPDGVQLWPAHHLEPASALSMGDPCEPLRPLRLVSARNGVVSGKIMVGSNRSIDGLAATAGELRGTGGVIPAAAVTLRYGVVWGSEAGSAGSQAQFYGALADRPPANLPVPAGGTPDRAGVAIPVWVTVRVPAGVPAGRYAGHITIKAAGQNPTPAPVELWVADLTLPDSQNYGTWVELIQVPDVTAIEYGHPLWSEPHWEMMAQSMRLIRDSGTRIVYLPAIAHTNLGNAESMIRWIPKGDGFEWDFSILERYLDLAVKEMGAPKVVVLQVWDIYMASKESIGKRFAPELEQRQNRVGGNVPLVTMLDRATGAVHNEGAPLLDDPRSKALWMALVQHVRTRLQARGLGDRLMFGMFTDAIPPKEHIAFFHAIAPDVPWVQQGHGLWTSKVHGIADVGYQASVWGGFRFGDGLRQTNQREDPVVASLHGWNRPRLDAVYERNNGLDSYPSTRWYFYPETCITGDLRGFGRTGADYWKAIKDNRGRRISWAHDRFAEGVWGGSSINLLLCSSTLAPGPDGPAATTRLMNLIEGVQAAEARIVIERALIDDARKARLGPELAARCQAALDRRLFDMWRSLSNYQLAGEDFFGIGAWRWTTGIAGHRWYLGTDVERATAELYTLAGAVQKALGAGRQ